MRRTALVALIGAVISSATIGATPAAGAGGTYTVAFCGELNRELGAVVKDARAYAVRDKCSDPDAGYAARIESIDSTQASRSAYLEWQVGGPLAIVGMRADANLRAAAGHKPRIVAVDAEGRIGDVIAEDDGKSGFEPINWAGVAHAGVRASLSCERSNGCNQSFDAKTLLRNVEFTVADYADPEVQVDGGLFGDDWQRGVREGGLLLGDDGSGIASAKIAINNFENPVGAPR